MIEGHEDPNLPMMIDAFFYWDLRDNKQMDASECADKFVRKTLFDESIVDYAISNLNAMEPSNDDCDCNKEEKTNWEPD